MEKNRTRGFLTFLLLVVYMVFSPGIYAQQKTLQGKVTDIKNMPLPGVTVVIEGTTIGTVTNMDGAYTLDVPSDAATLVFSYIGMLTQKIVIGNQTSINATMKEDVVGLEEVVVVGYGTRVKEELTGAVSTISEEEMTVSTAPSVVSRLQGQVSGVTVTSANRPGGDATIRIRGIGTINDSDPLYVIDGVPTGPGNNISPSDIESISILKDASSAAIYGTRGANGVVIITTKRGRENQQPSINFSIKTGITNATTKYDMLNTTEYADAVWLSRSNNGTTAAHAQYGSGVSPVIPDYIIPAGAMEGDAAVNPSLYDYETYAITKANKQGTDWFDEIYRTGVIQEYDISISGGGNKGTYAFSSNYLDEDGFLDNTKFKRYTFRMNSDAKFNKWFRAGESLQGVYIDEHGRFTNNAEDSPISDAYRMQPIIPVYDIGGNFAGSRASEMGNAYNPVARLYRARNNNGKLVRVLGNIYSEITFMKGLTAKTLFGYNYSQWNYKGYTLPNLEHSEPTTVNSLSVDTNYSLQWNWSNTINFNRTFADVHKLNIILGTEAIDYLYRETNASRSQYFSEDPDYMELNSGESNIQNSGYASGWSLFSIFGRVNYDIFGKYFLEATVRRDGSSRFSADNRYGTFPAASAAWDISRENFMANATTWIDLLKVRLGWGISGNDQIGNYNSYSTYGTDVIQAAYDFSGSNTSTSSGFIPSTLGNDDVTWETTHTINLGLDAVLLDNTLNLSLDLWKRKTSDMLVQEPIPQVMGVAEAPFVNIGEMENKGFDIEIGYNNTALNGDFRYNVTLTASHYKNEITKLSGDPDRTVDAGSLRQMTYTRYTTGRAFPEFYGYIVDGIFQTQNEADAHPQYSGSDYNKPGHFKYRNIDTAMEDTDGDGEADSQVINTDDRTFIGSPHPDIIGGLNIDLGYKDFDLNLFFYGSYGNKMVNYVTRWIDYGMFNGGLSKDALYNSWTSSNTGARLPMLDQDDISQQPSTAFIEDASFLRLKNIRLGYTLPKSLLERIEVKNLSVYLQVSNLFTITGYRGLDPEVNASGDGMGLDQGAWPTPRQIMLGINLGL